VRKPERGLIRASCDTDAFEQLHDHRVNTFDFHLLQVRGREGATHHCVTPPSEPGERVAPHPAQATGREFKVSDGAPDDWCSRVTFTRTGIQLFPGMSPLLPVLSTRHPATSAPFRVGSYPIRRVMSSPCLSAAGVRFLAVLAHWSISITFDHCSDKDVSATCVPLCVTTLPPRLHVHSTRSQLFLA
jgi:hypothetical protein